MQRPLPVSQWLGVSTEQRLWLLLRAAVGFSGIAFSMAALERLPLGDASALGFVSPVVSTVVAWLTMGERLGATEAACILASSERQHQPTTRPWADRVPTCTPE